MVNQIGIFPQLIKVKVCRLFQIFSLIIPNNFCLDENSLTQLYPAIF